MKKNNHGGKRPGSGRKKIIDPKMGIKIYPRKSVVDNLGGYSEAKKKAEDYLNSIFPLME